MKLKIRTANEQDIPYMTHLLEQLFSIEADFQINRAKQETGLRLLLKSPAAKIFIAENAQKVIGMCTAQVLISTAEGAQSGLIEDVVVDAHHRGNGIGQALLLALDTWATRNGLARLQLLADHDNAPALRFYEKQNWKPTRLICMKKPAAQFAQ